MSGFTTADVDAATVAPGDAILFLGRVQPIVDVEPYPEPGRQRMGYPEGTRLAHGLNGWGITLIPGQRMTVATRT